MRMKWNGEEIGPEFGDGESATFTGVYDDTTRVAPTYRREAVCTAITETTAHFQMASGVHFSIEPKDAAYLAQWTVGNTYTFDVLFSNHAEP